MKKNSKRFFSFCSFLYCCKILWGICWNYRNERNHHNNIIMDYFWVYDYWNLFDLSDSCCYWRFRKSISICFVLYSNNSFKPNSFIPDSSFLWWLLYTWRFYRLFIAFGGAFYFEHRRCKTKKLKERE